MLAGLSLLRPIREGSVSGLSLARRQPCSPCVSARSLVFLHGYLSSFFPGGKCNSHAELESILMISFQFDYLCKDPLSKWGHILRYWALGQQYIFLEGNTIQPITEVYNGLELWIDVLEKEVHC